MNRSFWKWFFFGAGVLLLAGIYYYPVLKKHRNFDRTIRYSPSRYRPYDTRFFFETVSKYPEFRKNSRPPGTQTLTGENNLYIICSTYFLPDATEKRELLKFVGSGNHLLISSFVYDTSFMKDVSNRIKIDSLKSPITTLGTDDSLSISWFSGKQWKYPGSSARSTLTSSFPNPDDTQVLARNGKGEPAFIVLKYGKGKIFLQTEPITFTNYFLLHKENYSYLEEILKITDIESRKVIWDDYYFRIKQHSDRSKEDTNKERGKSFFMQILKKHIPLQWAVLTFISTIILFILNHSRRLRQPVNKLPDAKNTSLDFTRAIAEMYLNKKDNSIIANKIAHQLQEHLYTSYKISSTELIPENIDNIVSKTGRTRDECEALIRYTSELRSKTKVTDQELTDFYRLTYKFIYK